MTFAAVFFLVLFFAIIIRRPAAGGWIILVFLPGYLLRFSVFSIPTTWLEAAIYLWFFLTLFILIKQKKLKLSVRLIYQKLKPLIVPIGLFFLAGFVSVFVSPDLLKAAGAFKAWIFDAVLFLFLFVHYYRREDYKKIVISFCCLLWLVSGWALLELLAGFGMQIPGYANAMYQSANMAALLLVPIWFLVFGFAVSEIKINNNKNSLFFIFYLIALLVGALVIYFTKSYAGLAAFAAGLVVFWMFIPKSYQKIKVYSLIFLLLAALATSAVLVRQGKFKNFINKPSDGYNSLDTRQQIWRVGSLLLQDNFFLGVGFDNFEKSYYQLAFEIYRPPLEWEVPKAHNLYLNTWLEMGFLGILSLVWLAVWFFLIIARLLRYFVSDFKINRRFYFGSLGLLAAFVSILAHGLLDTPYFKNDLSILWWSVFALLIIQSDGLIDKRKEK